MLPKAHMYGHSSFTCLAAMAGNTCRHTSLLCKHIHIYRHTTASQHQQRLMYKMLIGQISVTFDYSLVPGNT